MSDAGAYLFAGWNSGSGVFVLVAVIRSVVDAKTDSSRLWRDMENSNLVLNISDHPWMGVGFGHEYVEYQKLEDVSGTYPQYRYATSRTTACSRSSPSPALSEGLASGPCWLQPSSWASSSCSSMLSKPMETSGSVSGSLL